MKSILLPLSGSAHAAVAVPVAKELARMLDATCHIVHVGSRALAPGELPDRIGLGRDRLQSFILHQAVGDPAERILDLATELDAAAIVMCTGTALDEPGVLGPTAERVTQTAPCPIVLVRPDRGLEPWLLEEILLPYDGTPSTAVALRPAATLAKCAHARLFTVYVAQPQTEAPEESGSMSVPQYVDQPQHEWSAWATEFVQRLTSVCDFDPSQLRLFVAHGNPGAEINRLSREHGIDLIVVAWKGLFALDRALTAKEILRQAPCPILVLRKETTADSMLCP